MLKQVFDEQAAQAMGLRRGQVCVLIHSGSRGLGYQVCDDALKTLRTAPQKYGIELPDRQLVCAPLDSPEGQHYLGAMRAAANFAWCNRQLLMWETREVFQKVFGRSWEELDMHLIYDVAHNIAKFEEHTLDGQKKIVCVHRKGATRAFPPHHPETPLEYQEVGQPVIIPGDMGRASWVLVGQPGSMEQTFGSACHGAGRMMSRRGGPANPRIGRSNENWKTRESSRRPALGGDWPRNNRRPTRMSISWWRSFTMRGWPARWPACGRWESSKADFPVCSVQPPRRQMSTMTRACQPWSVCFTSSW
jgi:hypothetical protein